MKDKVQNAAFKYLISKKNMHSKVKDLSYPRLESQVYIKSGLFSNDELEMLFSMRSKMIQVKCNFPGLNKDEKRCSLGCPDIEDQEHILNCRYLSEHLEDQSILAEVSYQDIFNTVEDQKNVVMVYKQLLEIRKDLIEK